MDEKTELADNVIKAYRKSLLYLISRALEPAVPTPILGLEESIRADASLRALFDYPGGQTENADLIFSPNSAGGYRSSNSTAHGGFGNEPDTLNSVVRRITGKPALAAFPADFKDTVESIGTRAVPVAPAGVRSTPVRRALCIGIDDYPTAPLSGCVNDARLWAATFDTLGFDSVGLLVNEQASQAGILAALEEMVVSARPGDALVVQYSGHGTQVEDLDGDEANQIPPDAIDEALVPYDYQSGHLIIDDDLGRVFDKLPQGVGLTVFLDCCHSGTATRAFSLVRPPRAASSENERYIVLDRGALDAFRELRESEPLSRASAPEGMREVTFAACQPTQTAKEKDGHGYFTLAATALLANGDTPTNAAFLKLVSENFPLPPSSQLPHLHCPDTALGLPLFAIAPGGPAISPSVIPRDPSTATTGDARLLMETINRYLILLDRLTPPKP